MQALGADAALAGRDQQGVQVILEVRITKAAEQAECGLQHERQRCVAAFDNV